MKPPVIDCYFFSFVVGKSSLKITLDTQFDKHQTNKQTHKQSIRRVWRYKSCNQNP